MKKTSARQFVVGYGSLLSRESRTRFSAIHGKSQPITLHGWQRSWRTRSADEKQTYVGAVREEASSLNGVLIEVEHISPDLQKREQDYQFVSLAPDQLELHASKKDRNSMTIDPNSDQLWICETLHSQPATPDFPVYQSYIDTCLMGCLETEIESFARDFVEKTDWWHHHWRNDRAKPQYPRAAKPGKQALKKIDGLLAELDVLVYREP